MILAGTRDARDEDDDDDDARAAGEGLVGSSTAMSSETTSRAGFRRLLRLLLFEVLLLSLPLNALASDSLFRRLTANATEAATASTNAPATPPATAAIGNVDVSIALLLCVWFAGPPGFGLGVGDAMVISFITTSGKPKVPTEAY